jgi:hypothetical protein
LAALAQAEDRRAVPNGLAGMFHVPRREHSGNRDVSEWDRGGKRSAV